MIRARLLAGRPTDDGSKDLEIFVLRHQLRVLRRKAGRPRLRRFDRVLLEAVLMGALLLKDPAAAEALYAR